MEEPTTQILAGIICVIFAKVLDLALERIEKKTSKKNSTKSKKS